MLKILLNLYDFETEITYSVQGLVYGLGRGNSNAVKGKRVFLLPNILAVSEAHPAPYPVNNGALSWEVKRLTTLRYVVPKLRMGGTTLLLHQYDFMAWKGTVLLLPLSS